ncbi:MAG: KEOPS complex subunit Cgi121 [Halobellus sp.]|uniref:KEOPS complex subunit Cgi121 n=1 Tax=Halobellus sp. TaxID=1979212 RepID=UPI0035D3F033
MKLLEGIVEVDDVDSFVATVDEISRETEATIQTFDARYLVSDRHLERAVDLADRAIDRGESIARDRAVEILLYAAARRQITDALELGVTEGANRAVVLVDGGDEREAAAAVRSRLLTAAEPTLGDYDPERVRTFFDVGDAELDVVDGDLESVVLERVALLVVEK